MARDSDGTPRKRFSRSGHTSHRTPVSPPQPVDPAPYLPPPPPPGPRYAPTREFGPPAPDPVYDVDNRGYADDRVASSTERLPGLDPPVAPPPPFGSPTYHRPPPPPPPDDRYPPRYIDRGYDRPDARYDERRDGRRPGDRGHDERPYDDRGSADPRDRGYDRRGPDDGRYDDRPYGDRGHDQRRPADRGHDPQGYDDRTYDRRGYDAGGYDRRGYDDRGYDRRGYDDRGYDERGYDQRGYDQRGYDDRGYDQRGPEMARDNRTVVQPGHGAAPGPAGAYPPSSFAPTDAPSQGGATPLDATVVQGGDSPTMGRAALSLGKATISSTNRAARTVTRKVITASKSDGAEESGLTSLIWNQVLSYGTDAMVTVALAGTVFFGASANAQRGNVLLYLLVTMAPFAVVAPVIGPALDRLQHGRRWTMAGTAIGRAVLALVMAAHPTELLVLYPCALGSLVLSKAYGVVRAAAAPRLVPPGMTLTEANAKLTIFGLGSTVVLGGLVGIIIKVTGSYTAGLIVTAIGFAACGFFSFRLPKQVDSAAAAPRHPEEPVRPRAQDKVPAMSRIQSWAKRGFDPHLVIALQGESVLRLLSGMLTIYLAFYVESTAHGLDAALQLGGVVGAAGVGNFLGTAIGTRLKMARPEAVIIASTAIAAAVCIVGAVLFSVLVACIAMLVCAVTNALSKIALDSLIQHDVLETLRSSAFARSETFLQLAWVVGAALAVAIPSTSTGDGTIAFGVAAAITAAVAAVVFLRNRAADRIGTPRAPHGAYQGGGQTT